MESILTIKEFNVRRFICLASLLLLATVFVSAQDYPKAEVFGGYQYTHLEGGVNANGWNAAVTGNLNHWFGVTGDFSGAYATVDGVSIRNYTYTFGPTVSLRANHGFTPFAHALFGGAHVTGSLGDVSASDSGFATLIGGGVDVNASKNISIRAAQFDWVMLHSNGDTSSKNVRLSFGVVFHP